MWAPKRVRVVKRGDYVYMSLARDDGVFHMAGGWLRTQLTGPFYVGIGVSAHDKDVVEKAVFSNVEIKTGSPAASGPPKLYSTLETILPLASGFDRTVVYSAGGAFRSAQLDA